jgi:peptidoglycan/xylan/chitin deacetylase (PgdA/CDA1 family)
MAGLKTALLSLLRAPAATAPFATIMGRRATIFMLHRFRDEETSLDRHDPETLRADLEYLRRHRYEILDLEELFRRLSGEGPPFRRAVAFTIDDGYADQAEVAGPLFAAYDCPVTTFVTTGFLDARLWFWWDRIEYAFTRSPRDTIRMDLGGSALSYDWCGDADRRRAQADFTERCKRVPDAAKHEAIRTLARCLEVEIPETAPARYGPMSWDDARRAETKGMRFGPHTVTHPILSQVDDVQARAELEDSWARLRAEVRNPAPIFCYPNGGWNDFGEREPRLLAEMGLAGAVVGESGYADARAFTKARTSRFAVRRFSYPDDHLKFVQYASGVERAKQILRREPVD